MFRLCKKSSRHFRLTRFFSQFPSQIYQKTPNNLTNPPQKLPSPKPSFPLSPLSSPKSFSLFALSAAFFSAAFIALSSPDSDRLKKRSKQLYAEMEESLEKSNDSVQRVFNRVRQTGVATAVLWKSLRSVLSSANQEVRSGFELRVAALLADIAAANEARRSAIVGAGGGAVVDWLLETVGSARNGTQAEAARALASLIADPQVCAEVLGRPRAVPNLLKFIFSFQPRTKKQIKHNSLGGTGIHKGRSMLVAAIMDIITSNCDSIEQASFLPTLPGDASMADIAAILQVIEEGGMQLDDSEESNDEDGDEGLRGIGMKILGGTTVLGFSRTDGLLKLDQSDEHIYNSPVLLKSQHNLSVEGSSTSGTTPGLWDDLQREHVAVPFATWALANWAMASDINRNHIQELDREGQAIMTALMAPERTVKWHASLVARLLLEDQNLPLTDSVPEWSSSLLSTISQACLAEDITLARVAFSAFLVSLERSSGAQNVVWEKGLNLLRQIAKQTEKHQNMQEGLAKALELLSTGNNHLSLEDSQKWFSILLHWVCGKFSTDATRFSAMKILSCICEDYGPTSVPISQGWLTVLLTEILNIGKMTVSQGNTQPKMDKVKAQIGQSTALSATQTANQLAHAVVNLSVSQFEPTTIFAGGSPLAEFLSLEPFAEQFKNMKKDSLAKFDAADSAMATVKGIKALTEICIDDTSCQNKIADFGILCLLRRFLLRDDYEKLGAIETYDASRILENQELAPSISDVPPVSNANDPYKVRVPPTAHIRKHAARLLVILSLLPKVQKAIIKDEIWCKWLEDCAYGKIPGCNDLKIQSYARATLLNIFCHEQVNGDSEIDDNHGMEGRNWKNICPRYADMIFLINPELPHWKCPDKNDYDPPKSNGETGVVKGDSDYGGSSTNVNNSDKCSQSADPLLDIVFVHGLRGGPFKTWRIAEDKTSTTSKSGLVEKIDQEAGKEGTCWPREWLPDDFPHARLFTVKYKTNLTLWSGASLPLQEVSSMLLKKLAAAGIGKRPVVFVTHSMGGLVVKQMLYQAKMDNFKELLNNTIGVVFYSCPHFGSKLADMPWRMGYVFRPAPTIRELRSGSPWLVELNDFLRHRHNKGLLDVLSFSETKVTPLVEGYGGWAFRMEVVPIESAYPGFGELVVLEATDHINSCKPVNRTDLSYSETLSFLQKLKTHYT